MKFWLPTPGTCSYFFSTAGSELRGGVHAGMPGHRVRTDAPNGGVAVAILSVVAEEQYGLILVWQPDREFSGGKGAVCLIPGLPFARCPRPA
jgi:hypothetical protein